MLTGNFWMGRDIAIFSAAIKNRDEEEVDTLPVLN